MERLTISKITEETGAYELAHNCTFIRDGETWYRDFDNEIRLRDMMREIIKNHSQYDEQCDDDEILDEILFENLQYPADDIDGLIAVFSILAWSHSDLRERLKAYEDTGLTPERVQQLKERDTETYLMDYIMRHTYSCPIKDDSDIDFEKECVGFKEVGCRECIMRHLEELR